MECVEDLNPLGQTGEQLGVVHSVETLRIDSVPESLGARRFVEDPTTAADGVGGGEWSTITMGDSMETPGAAARAAESSKAEAGAVGAAPKSGAQGVVGRLYGHRAPKERHRLWRKRTTSRRSSVKDHDLRPSASSASEGMKL